MRFIEIPIIVAYTKHDFEAVETLLRYQEQDVNPLFSEVADSIKYATKTFYTFYTFYT